MTQPVARRPRDPEAIGRSLARFRVASIIEGIALLVLVAIMVMKYLVFGDPGDQHELWSTISSRWSPIHGLIYMVYFVLGFDLWSRMRWGLGRMAQLAVFGVVPVLSFFGERWTSTRVETELARDADDAGTGASATGTGSAEGSGTVESGS